jgi:hypothetical protein
MKLSLKERTGRAWSALAAVIILLSASCRAESGPANAGQSERQIFDRVMQTAQIERWDAMELGMIVQSVGEEFLGTRYEGGVLDHGTTESLVVTFDAFDCQLFVETVLAIARGIRSGDLSYEGFLRRLEEQRYRSGVLDGYLSRLHYFTEWIRDNERRGIVKDVTRSMGGRVTTRRLDFMSKHRNAYPRFAADDSVLEGIVEMERVLGETEIAYIPQEEIRSVAVLMKPGDIIATATSVEGLDVSHTGFAYDRGDGAVGFLHASTDGGVKVSPDLQAYVQSNKIQTGVLVVRPQEDADE